MAWEILTPGRTIQPRNHSQSDIAIAIFFHSHSHFSWTFVTKRERCMRLSLCEAPTHEMEQHKGQPQYWELHTHTLRPVAPVGPWPPGSPGGPFEEK